MKIYRHQICMFIRCKDNKSKCEWIHFQSSKHHGCVFIAPWPNFYHTIKLIRLIYVRNVDFYRLSFAILKLVSKLASLFSHDHAFDIDVVYSLAFRLIYHLPLITLHASQEIERAPTKIGMKRMIDVYALHSREFHSMNANSK